MTEKNLEKEKEKAEEKNKLLADIFLARHYSEILKQENCSVLDAAMIDYFKQLYK